MARWHRLSRLAIHARPTLSQTWALMLIGASTAFIGCSKKTTLVHVTVLAKTNLGEAVPNALVRLDDRAVGQTDSLGSFETRVDLPADSNERIEVSKQSDDYYFAPYVESFPVVLGKSKDISIHAVLYFVPKPEPKSPGDRPNSAVAQSNDPNANKTESAVSPTASSRGLEPELSPKGQSLPSPAGPGAVAVQSTQVSSPTPEPSSAAGPRTDEPTTQVGATALSARDPSESTGEDEEPKLALSHVDLSAPAPEGLADDLETPFTLTVKSELKPLAGAEILAGELGKGHLAFLCRTSPQGRCRVRFKEKPLVPVTFVVRKAGYRTQSLSTRISPSGALSFNLEAGQNIDIYALTQTYQYVRGLPEVQVYVRGKHVGETDSFGHYAYVFKGKADELVEISLRPHEELPEDFTTDFVASGPMTLVRYFTPKQPSPLKVAVLNPQAAGALADGPQVANGSMADHAIRVASYKYLFASPAFKEVSLAALGAAVKGEEKGVASLLRYGWQSSELKGLVDALLVPTLLVAGERMYLEISLVDSHAHVVTAAKESLASANDAAAVAHAVAAMAEKMISSLPFEGAVLSKDGEKVVINSGTLSGRAVRPGDKLDVYGVQINPKGRSQTVKRVATLVVIQVDAATSTCTLEQQVPRSAVGRGDLVVLRPRRKQAEGDVLVTVTTLQPGGAHEPVAQANIYLNDEWVGASDANGKLTIDPKRYADGAMLTAIKRGFGAFNAKVGISAKTPIAVVLERQVAYLNLRTEPSGAVVKVDGKTIGKTPFSSAVHVSGNLVDVELDGPEGYKPYHHLINLEQASWGSDTAPPVTLEKDFMALARKQEAAGQIAKAVAVLDEVPKEHSDYLLAHHMAGELSLTGLDDPAKAAAEFAVVTGNPAVHDFSDRRFIGSHVDEGMALFYAAEREATSQPDVAAAQYRKAIEAFKAVTPYLRFIPQNQFAQAVHNVDYHLALCQHKLWYLTKDPAMLMAAYSAWRDFLDGSARSLPASGDGKTYLASAQAYFKQAKAALGERLVR